MVSLLLADFGKRVRDWRTSQFDEDGFIFGVPVENETEMEKRME